jgi:transcriptional regulator with XRE-family HTH domain
MSTKEYNSFEDLWGDIESSDEFATSEAILDFTIELENMVKKRGLSRADLAKKIGKSQPYISKIFRGDTNFTISTMIKLVRAVNGKLSQHITPREEGDIGWLRKIEGGASLLPYGQNNKADAWFEKVDEDQTLPEIVSVANGGTYEYPFAS